MREEKSSESEEESPIKSVHSSSESQEQPHQDDRLPTDVLQVIDNTNVETQPLKQQESSSEESQEEPKSVEYDEETKFKIDLINNKKNNIVKVLAGRLDPNVEDLLKQAEIE